MQSYCNKKMNVNKGIWTLEVFNIVQYDLFHKSFIFLSLV